MNRPVWQPESLSQDSYEFAIRVDGDFGRELLQRQGPDGYQDTVNELSRDMLERKYDTDYPQPVRFYSDTMYATGFHIGNNGTWLAMNGSPEDILLERERDFARYHSHNVDYSHDAIVLMSLVDKWTEGAAALLG